MQAARVRGRLQGARQRWLVLWHLCPACPQVPDSQRESRCQHSCRVCGNGSGPGRLSSWGGGNPPEVNVPSAVKGRPQAGLERAAPSLVPSLSGCSVVLLELLRGQKSLVSPCCSPAFPSGLISHPLGAPSRPLEQPAPHPTPSLQKGCKHASPKVTSQRPPGKHLCKFLCNAPQLVSLTYLMLRLSRIWRVRVLQTGSCVL